MTGYFGNRSGMAQGLERCEAVPRERIPDHPRRFSASLRSKPGNKSLHRCSDPWEQMLCRPGGNCNRWREKFHRGDRSESEVAQSPVAKRGPPKGPGHFIDFLKLFYLAHANHHQLRHSVRYECHGQHPSQPSTWENAPSCPLMPIYFPRPAFSSPQAASPSD